MEQKQRGRKLGKPAFRSDISYDEFILRVRGLGYTAKKFAKRLGVSGITVYNWKYCGVPLWAVHTLELIEQNGPITQYKKPAKHEYLTQVLANNGIVCKVTLDSKAFADWLHEEVTALVVERMQARLSHVDADLVSDAVCDVLERLL